jgi:adenylate cyclase
LKTASTILVVDDEPDVELLVTQRFRAAIRSKEFFFLFARDGEEALQILKAHPEVDLVLSDINMPRMDGLTLLKHLQTFDEQLRAVLVSAYGDMPNIRRAMNLGAFDFVTKPIEFEDLEVTINRAITDLEKVREIRRQRETAEHEKAALSRYFSPNLIEQLSGGEATIDFSGERRELSFVFTDLAEFTGLVESLEPEIVVPLLNEYLSGLTRIVFANGGTMDKVVGDAVHAMFGAPAQQLDHPGRAIDCARAMDQFAEEFRQRAIDSGIALGETRIGVHSGLAIVGNFGGDSYFDYTAHGNAVNIAARLEGVNKFLGTRVCISQATIDGVADFEGRPMGIVSVQGITEHLAIFEPIDPDHNSASRTNDYLAAYSLMQARDPGANQAFAAYVGKHGEDPLAMFHLKRLLAGESGDNVVLPGK